MDNTHAISGWAWSDGAWDYDTYWTGEDFDEALKQFKAAKAAGIACVQWEWREATFKGNKKKEEED